MPIQAHRGDRDITQNRFATRQCKYVENRYRQFPKSRKRNVMDGQNFRRRIIRTSIALRYKIILKDSQTF